VVLYSSPGSACGTTSTIKIVNTHTSAIITAAGGAIGYLKTSAAVPLQSLDPWGQVTSMYAVTVDPAYASRVTILANYQDGTPAVLKFATVATKYEWDIIHIFVQQSNEFLHTFAFAAMYMPWLYRNNYVGVHIPTLTPHLDDVYLDTESAVTKIAFRCGRDDFAAYAAHQRAIAARFAAGSYIKSGIPFNAVGVDEHGGFNVDELVTATYEQCSEFEWMSHTFRHTNLDKLTYAVALEEMTTNEVYANQLFSSCMQHYHISAMVTPEISGLKNGNALKAMWDTGKRVCTGDNSQPALIAPNPYHALVTTVAANGFDGMLIVPRFSTEINFASLNPDEEVIYYNSQSWNPITKNYSEILKLEAYLASRAALSLRRDAHMFHQGNIKRYDGLNSMVGDWLTAVADLLSPMINVPLRSLLLAEQGELIRKKMDRDSAVIQIVSEYRDVVVGGITNKEHYQIALNSSKNVEIPLVGFDVLPHPNVRCETIGNHYINWVTVLANTPVQLLLAGVASCGNKIRDVGEDCDSGLNCTACKCDLNYIPVSSTSIDCVYTPSCGNKIRDVGEDCDSGLNCYSCRCNVNYIPVNSTSIDCVYTPSCGNKIRDVGEDCDSGLHCTACKCDLNYIPVSDASIDCVYLPSCGNKIRDAGEECDSCDNCIACKCAAGYYPHVTTNECIPSASSCGNGVREAGEECDGGYHCLPNCVCEFGYHGTFTPTSGCEINEADKYLISPTSMVNEVGQCYVPSTGLGCLSFVELVNYQDIQNAYISCSGMYSGVFYFTLPSEISKEAISAMQLSVNYRAASILYQRAEWYIRRPQDSAWIRLFATGDMGYVTDWIWSRYDSKLIASPASYVDSETIVIDGKPTLKQFVMLRYIVANGKPQPVTHLDLFLLSIKVNDTQVISDCGDGKLNGNEQCDGGYGCTSECECEITKEPTVPASINCQDIFVPVAGSWSVYPNRLLMAYGALDIPEDGVMCLVTKDEQGMTDHWGRYIELLAPFSGDFSFTLPPNARLSIGNLQLTVNYRGTDMSRQRGTWYIKDRINKYYVKLFSLFDMPYLYSWTWQEHVHKISSNCENYIDYSTGEVTVRFISELGKPEPASQFDYLELKAERI
jgi:hypothetical protein